MGMTVCKSKTRIVYGAANSVGASRKGSPENGKEETTRSRLAQKRRGIFQEIERPPTAVCPAP